MSDGIRHQIGPFMYADGALRTRVVDDITYKVGIAGAYNAFGLIGPEHNGLFVLDDTNKQVILDQHAKEQTGYFGPSNEQWEALRHVMQLPEHDFIHFIHNHPRSRLPQRDHTEA